MRTIRRQLTRKLLLCFALLLGFGVVTVYLAAWSGLYDQFDETLRAKANAISAATEQHGQRVNAEIREQFMRESDEGVAIDFFQLRRADGTNIRRSKSLADADLPSRFGTFDRPKFWNMTLPSGVGGRAIGYTFSPRSQRKTETPDSLVLTLVLASDRRELDESLAILALVLFGCGALVLVATALVVPRVLRQELAPLQELAEQAGRITADSLSTRFPADSVPGELQPIINRLNNLLSRLEQSFQREKQFSADLAHELRTPIAELRSLADLALRWPESRPAETDRDIRAISIQMEGIVTRLLDLIRSDGGQLVKTRTPVQLGSFASVVWQSFAEKAAEKRLQIMRNDPGDVTIQSDPVLLRAVLSNLMDNAVEYTPYQGTVQIRIEVSGNRFILKITNTVEQLVKEDLPRFFDRFWRKDSARSGAKHSGLGLSLARSFAAALGYQLDIAPDGESQITLTLSGPTC